MCPRSLPGGITHARRGGGPCPRPLLQGDLWSFGEPGRCVQPEQKPGSALSSFRALPGKGGCHHASGSSFLMVIVFLARKGQRNVLNGSTPVSYFSTSVTDWPASQLCSLLVSNFQFAGSQAGTGYGCGDSAAGMGS